LLAKNIAEVPMSSASGPSNFPLLIVMNAGSGHNDTETTREAIEQVLRQSGRSYRIIVVEDPARMDQIARMAVEEARACGGAVVAAGGDGTLNTVAAAVHGSGCPFGVLPQGTFNYFGRTHGIPEDVTEASRALLTAHVRPVQVGLVNNRLFLVSASLGLYPQLLEDREAYKRQYGRSRLVAFWAGLMTLLRQYRQLHITLEQQGRTSTMRTPTLFVANNRLQLEQIGIPLAGTVENGQLAAIAIRPVGTPAMLSLLLHGALGKLGDAENVISFGFRRLIVKPASRYRPHRVKVATDGEVAWMTSPLEFRVSPEPLYLLTPNLQLATKTVADQGPA
jgi:diacylglycerol kinase family enzyme